MFHVSLWIRVSFIFVHCFNICYSFHHLWLSLSSLDPISFTFIVFWGPLSCVLVFILSQINFGQDGIMKLSIFRMFLVFDIFLGVIALSCTIWSPFIICFVSLIPFFSSFYFLNFVSHFSFFRFFFFDFFLFMSFLLASCQVFG